MRSLACGAASLARCPRWSALISGSRTSPSHPDQVAGGSPAGLKDLGSSRINSLIGSQWGNKQASLLDQGIDRVRAAENATQFEDKAAQKAAARELVEGKRTIMARGRRELGVWSVLVALAALACGGTGTTDDNGDGVGGSPGSGGAV